ncbi:MAG: hypothetical protein WA040_24610, partial [Anaerolineae bacterium]
MPTPRKPITDRRLRSPRALAWVIVGLFVLGVLAVMPGAWALPNQAPDFQTVPTLTPTPTRPSGGATATNTPPGAPPTNTPPPGATATYTPPPGSTATSTPTPGPSATPTA